MCTISHRRKNKSNPDDFIAKQNGRNPSQNCLLGRIQPPPSSNIFFLPSPSSSPANDPHFSTLPQHEERGHTPVRSSARPTFTRSLERRCPRLWVHHCPALHGPAACCTHSSADFVYTRPELSQPPRIEIPNERTIALNFFYIASIHKCLNETNA